MINDTWLSASRVVIKLSLPTIKARKKIREEEKRETRTIVVLGCRQLPGVCVSLSLSSTSSKVIRYFLVEFFMLFFRCCSSPGTSSKARGSIVGKDDALACLAGTDAGVCVCVAHLGRRFEGGAMVKGPGTEGHAHSTCVPPFVSTIDSEATWTGEY